MYGLVNKAIEQMVCTRYGVDAWETIKQRAGVDLDLFLSLRQYPDDMTYRLVGAASETLGASQAEILRAFGHYWTMYTAEEGYGELFRLTGGSLREFLHNLPNLHSRIDLSFPNLHPPIFKAIDLPDGGLLLHYYSERPGLAPMVVGLLEGLAERFHTAIAIAQVAAREQGAEHDVFRISFR
jgi:hypothetical protein